jgi:hypothetical protein
VVAGAAAGVAYQSGHGPPAAAGPTATPGATASVLVPIVVPGNPPSSLPNGTSRKPKLVLSQPFGDGHTVFVVHGSGFLPLTPVRIEIVGAGFSPDRPVADQKGTFNYGIDQGHEFYRGLIPAGFHKVVALGAGGRRASITFQVVPLGQPLGGAGPPPPA